MAIEITPRGRSRVDVLAPAQLGPLKLRNRVIKSATFEGVTPEGLVSRELIDFHLAVARGGVGLTTVAYCAVAPEGRTERDQIFWRPEVLAGLKELTDEIHETGTKISAQIGHAGPVANSKSTKLPALSPSRRFNPLSMSFDKEASPADIHRIIRAHADAAERAAEVGFDAVEVHFGHNYLVSSFLSPKINHRKDAWGGSLENRAELPRQILAAIRERVGTSLAVIAKMNMDDGVRGGFWLDESIPFATMLESDGHLDALELTGGSSLLNPMYLFRGGVPLREMAATQEPLLQLGMNVFGRAVFKSYPYSDLYFLEYARQFRDVLTMPLILLGGVTNKADMDRAMDEGFEFVAMGRALLREPDLVQSLTKDAQKTSLCIHCNLCAASIFTGTRCPIAQK